MSTETSFRTSVDVMLAVIAQAAKEGVSMGLSCPGDGTVTAVVTAEAAERVRRWIVGSWAESGARNSGWLVEDGFLETNTAVEVSRTIYKAFVLGSYESANALLVARGGPAWCPGDATLLVEQMQELLVAHAIEQRSEPLARLLIEYLGGDGEDPIWTERLGDANRKWFASVLCAARAERQAAEDGDEPVEDVGPKM